MKLKINEIRKNLKNLSPFQIKEFQKSFHGQKIEWELNFFDILTIPGSEEVTVHCDTKDEFGHCIAIFFDLDINKYPELKIIQRGDVLSVCADIKSVKDEGRHIDLINISSLNFYKKSRSNGNACFVSDILDQTTKKNSLSDQDNINSYSDTNNGKSNKVSANSLSKKIKFSMDNPYIYSFVTIIIAIIVFYLPKILSNISN